MLLTTKLDGPPSTKTLKVPTTPVKWLKQILRSCVKVTVSFLTGFFLVGSRAMCVSLLGWRMMPTTREPRVPPRVSWQGSPTGRHPVGSSNRCLREDPNAILAGSPTVTALREWWRPSKETWRQRLLMERSRTKRTRPAKISLLETRFVFQHRQ